MTTAILEKPLKSEEFLKIISEYFPEAPYKIKTGEKAGKYIEELMFTNPTYVFRIKEYLDGKLREGSSTNGFHKHLSWVIAKSSLRMPTIMCPFCKERIAKNALFVRGVDGRYSSREELVSCGREKCMEQLKDTGLLSFSLRKREIVELKFSAIAQVPLDSEEIRYFLQRVFGIGELTPETAFRFFNK